MKNTLVALLAAVGVSSGCATFVRVDEGPIAVTGTPKSSKFTGWYRSACSGGGPVEGYPGNRECTQLGGELYEVRVQHPKSMEGVSLGRHVYVGYPAHALRFTMRNRESVLLVLQPSSEGFREATGLDYLAVHRSSYQPDACIVDDILMHSNVNTCLDRGFHEVNEKQCLTPEKLKEHFYEKRQ